MPLQKTSSKERILQDSREKNKTKEKNRTESRAQGPGQQAPPLRASLGQEASGTAATILKEHSFPLRLWSRTARQASVRTE